MFSYQCTSKVPPPWMSWLQAHWCTPYPRFKWADGGAGGACYLSLDLICLGELLVLPKRRHCLYSLCLLLFPWLYWWFDNSISSLSEEHRSIFSVLCCPLEGCKSRWMTAGGPAVPSLLMTKAYWFGGLIENRFIESICLCKSNYIKKCVKFKKANTKIYKLKEF